MSNDCNDKWYEFYYANELYNQMMTIVNGYDSTTRIAVRKDLLDPNICRNLNIRNHFLQLLLIIGIIHYSYLIVINYHISFTYFADKIKYFSLARLVRFFETMNFTSLGIK